MNDCVFPGPENGTHGVRNASCKHCGRVASIKHGISYRRNCVAKSTLSGTAGTHLSALLSLLMQSQTKSCRCRARANRMNAMGNDWCEQNIETIVEWLKEEASARGLPFFSTIARMLVRRAIANARKEASRGKEVTTT